MSEYEGEPFILLQLNFLKAAILDLRLRLQIC